MTHRWAIDGGEFVPASTCSFFGLGAILATFLGVSEDVGGAIAGALVGAGGGAAVDAITGKPVLPGLVEGGITGGAIAGLGGVIGDATGLGTTAGDALAGAGADAAASALFGQSPVTGALAGGAGGLLAGITSGAAPAATGGTAAPSGAGASAAGSAAPSSAGLPSSLSLGGGDSTIGFTDDAAAGGGGSPSSGGLPSTGATTTSGPFSQSSITSALQGSETSAGAAGIVGNATLGANSINEVPATTAGSGDFLSSLFGGSGSGGLGSTIKSWAGPALAAGGLGLDLLKSGQKLPDQAALSSEASQLATQGNQLQSYLASGTLPPGVQQSITQAADSAKAAIRSQYAQMGGDTSAMQADLANVDTMAASQGATIATQLLNSGVSETGLSEQIYSQLMTAAVSQNQQLSSALGNLAASMVRPTVLQVQGNAP